jgi:aspartyl-tRNA(Asn)/glutamyl-tRNA(Gln) amidotransferase subunit C
MAGMKITHEDVSRVAELAHLELSSDEIELYRNQLDEILSYVEKLQELDVSAVEPMAHLERGAAIDASATGHWPGDAGFLRPDKLRDCHTAEEILETAPDAVKPFFRVPKVIER